MVQKNIYIEIDNFLDFYFSNLEHLSFKFRFQIYIFCSTTYQLRIKLDTKKIEQLVETPMRIKGGSGVYESAIAVCCIHALNKKVNNPRNCGAQRAKITDKVHKPTQNHYIEWPVLSDIILNCESQGEKGRTCKKYKIIGSCVFFFHFIHDFLFSPGHLLKKNQCPLFFLT